MRRVLFLLGVLFLLHSVCLADVMPGPALGDNYGLVSNPRSSPPPWAGKEGSAPPPGWEHRNYPPDRPNGGTHTASVPEPMPFELFGLGALAIVLGLRECVRKSALP